MIRRCKQTIPVWRAFFGFVLFLPTLIGWALPAEEPPNQIVPWGRNIEGQTNIPPDLTNVVSISAGAFHTLALNIDGTLSAWGWNFYGQTNIPAGITNATAIAGGQYHSLALRANGTLVAWGDNSFDQTNMPAGITNATAITAGGYHSLALRADGTACAWGWNFYGQTNIPAGITHATAVSAGYRHSLLLLANGSIRAWGENTYGQTNVPIELTNAIAIAAGYRHSLALLANGTIAAWGNNADGQTNVPPSISNAIAIAAGYRHSMALLANGAVIVWGDNLYGQRTPPTWLTNSSMIAAGAYHSLALVPIQPLVITSDHGTPIPGTGTQWLIRNAYQTCTVTSAITQGWTQYVCIGWAGTGSAPMTGVTNAASFVITSNSTLQWLWQTNYWLQSSSNGNGTVTPASRWYQAGTNATLTGEPLSYWHFDSWTGDVPSAAATSNPVTLTMSSPRTIQARFVANVTSNQTPEWWLAELGWTSNFEQGAMADWDDDGMATWKEYIADVDPTDPDSYFGIQALSDGTAPTFHFYGSGSRVYSLDVASSMLSNTWQEVTGQARVPGTPGMTLTDTNPLSVTRRYYRVRVALP